MKILCMGDSWTDAEWAGVTSAAIYQERPPVADHWTSLLASELGYMLTNKGVAGDTTAGMKSRFAADVIANKPVLCTILGGGNDVYGSVAMDTIIENLTYMVEQCTANNIIPVLMCYPIKEDASGNIAVLHSRTLALAASKNIMCIDLYDTALLVNGTQQAACYLSDLVHLSTAGHRIIADKIETFLRHIRETRMARLRTALTAELSRRSQTAITYTDASLLGLPVKAVHTQEIRNKLDTVKTKTYADNPLVANQTVIKESHMTEMEDLVGVLEAAPKQGGTTTCNASCTGLCVSCTGSCTSGCTSCTGGCSGGCSGCSGSCSGGCSGCSGSCSGSCHGGCYGSCGYSGCGYGNCASGCQTSGCQSWCSSTCSGYCKTSCTLFCTSDCTGGNK